jgi:uncharacterized protein
LRVGQELPGIVTNIAAVGAFVDWGVHKDGLIHISNLQQHNGQKANRTTLSLHQHIRVRVLDVDLARQRIQLALV